MRSRVISDPVDHAGDAADAQRDRNGERRLNLEPDQIVDDDARRAASTDPTERSMPPPIMTNVSPIARMPRIERSRSVSLKL